MKKHVGKRVRYYMGDRVGQVIEYNPAGGDPDKSPTCCLLVQWENGQQEWHSAMQLVMDEQVVDKQRAEPPDDSLSQAGSPNLGRR